ncbi:MAG TPA: DoxX family protein, partial [Bacteroidetes bacterium]|nr:DoxX family protein [Bacteroidota bacterium]
AGKGEGYEFNLALLAMAVYLLLAGPGQLAILS